MEQMQEMGDSVILRACVGAKTCKSYGNIHRVFVEKTGELKCGLCGKIDGSLSSNLKESESLVWTLMRKMAAL